MSSSPSAPAIGGSVRPSGGSFVGESSHGAKRVTEENLNWMRHRTKPVCYVFKLHLQLAACNGDEG